MKSVRMSIGQPRKRQPPEPCSGARAAWTQDDFGDGSCFVAVDEHALSKLAADPRHLAPELIHSSAKTLASASIPASQSSGLTYSAGECETPEGLRTKIIAVGMP